MLLTLVKNWWAIVAVGVLAIIWGILSFAMPGATLASLVLGFGVYALVSGAVMLGAALNPNTDTGHGATSRIWLIVSGLVGVLAGLATFVFPLVTAVTLITVIGIWAVLAGITLVASAIAHRGERKDTFLMALGGAAAVIFGLYLFMQPGLGLLSLTYALGTFALIYGIVMVAAGIQLKRVGDIASVSIERDEARVGATDDRLMPH